MEDCVRSGEEGNRDATGCRCLRPLGTGEWRRPQYPDEALQRVVPEAGRYAGGEAGAGMKRSGYIVSVQFFVDADPNVPVSMTKAFETMDKVAAAVRSLAPMKMSHQFVRRHEVPGDAAAGKEEGVAHHLPVSGLENVQRKLYFGKK